MSPDEARPISTGSSELDRVLAGGLVPGSVTLVGGEPGVGKSTLLLQVMRRMSEADHTCLVVSAEESAQQVRLRAERLGPLPDRLQIIAGSSLVGLDRAVATLSPSLVVVDSIQAVQDPATGGHPGTLAQVRTCSDLLVRLAKASGSAFVLVGHVTKEGSLAGPRVLEHLVDTVLSVEGDRHHALRLVRSTKHRFGPTGEVGMFEMGPEGLRDVADPYLHLLGDRQDGIPGSSLFPGYEGQRPLLAEIQVLVASASGPQPRRLAQGVDGGRLGMLLAVLETRAGITAGQRDVFASAVGGIRISEPGADLPVALALASALSGKPIAADTVAFGEVGLAGEIRNVPHGLGRLNESRRLGFRQAIVPAGVDTGPAGLRLLRVGTLSHAVATALACG